MLLCRTFDIMRKKMNNKLLTALLILLFSVFSCEEKQSENSSKKQRSDKIMPSSQGETSEILIVIDSAHWFGEFGDLVRSVINPSYAGLLNDEPTFTLRRINPLGMNGMLNRAHTIIYVTNLESLSAGGKRLTSFLTEEQIKSIKSDENKFLQVHQDVFASPQRVFQIFGKDEKTLRKNLEKYKESIFKIIYEHILQKAAVKVFKKGEQKNLTENLRKRHGYSLKIPYGYALAKDEMNDETGFTFIRKIEGLYDHNLFITYKSYKDTADLNPAKIQAWRDSVCKKHIFDIETPESYVVTETLEPPRFRKIELNKLYAVEMRGLWRTSVKSMGGPFVSQTIVDTEKELLYYVEGFIYAPGKNKREFIREIEAILSTFRTK